MGIAPEKIFLTSSLTDSLPLLSDIIEKHKKYT